MILRITILLLICSFRVESQDAQDTVECDPDSFPIDKIATFEEITEELNEEDSKLVFIDVRNRSVVEEVGRPVGSVTLPLDELSHALALENLTEFSEIYNFEKPQPADSINIVLSSLSGEEALQAWSMARKAKYCDTRVYIGSYLNWEYNEGQVEFTSVATQSVNGKISIFVLPFLAMIAARFNV